MPVVPRRLTASPLVHGLRLLLRYLPEGYRSIFAWLAGIGLAVGVLEAGVLALIGLLGSSLASDRPADATTLGVGLLDDRGRTTLVLIGVAMIALTIVLRAAESHFVAKVGTAPLTNLRNALFRAYLRSSFTHQQNERGGELVDLLATHVPRAGFVVYYLAGAVSAGAMFVVLAGAAAVIDPVAFVVIVVAVALLWLLTLPLERLASRFGRLQNESSIDFTSDASEAAGAFKELRIFDVVDPVTDRLAQRAREVSHQIYVAKLTTSFTPNLYRALVLALLLIGLGVLNASGVGNVASAGTVVLLLVRALMASQLVSAYAQSAAEFVPFVDEITQRLDIYAASSTPEGSASLARVESIELRQVGHSYDEESPVLDGIELRIARGESVGLLGASGAGKSTLLSIVLGLIVPRTGVVLVNGVPIHEYTNSSLRTQIAAVPQDPLLVNASVADNIAFMRSGISQGDIESAARAAGIHDEIVAWPDGYDTVVGERGARALSGGQRQRVCIARALAGRPSLVILDEPTSALDNAAEEVVNQTLERLSGTCAVIVVSHRPEVLARCDRVVLLDSGRLSVSSPG